MNITELRNRIDQDLTGPGITVDVDWTGPRATLKQSRNVRVEFTRKPHRGPIFVRLKALHGDHVDVPLRNIKTIKKHEAPRPTTATQAERSWFWDEITHAMRNEDALFITYRSASKDEITSRTFIPTSVQDSKCGSTKVVTGFCAKRHDYRAFRLDRIRSLEVLKPKHRRVSDEETSQHCRFINLRLQTTPDVFRNVMQLRVDSQGTVGEATALCVVFSQVLGGSFRRVIVPYEGRSYTDIIITGKASVSQLWHALDHVRFRAGNEFARKS